MRRALLASTIAVGLVATVGIGTGTYLAMEKTVTLAVDGQSQEIHTFAGTVDDVLAEEDIEVGERDVVAPEPTTDVADGTRIAVRYARQLELTVDGETTTHWTTGTEVGEAFDQLGLRYRGADLSASRSAGIGRDGLELDVATNKRLTLEHDGEKTPVNTTGQVVSDALDDAGIELNGQDQVEPALGAELNDGASITVTRVRTKVNEVDVDLNYETTREADSEMYEGEETVETEGDTGLKVETRRVTYVDGERTKVKVLDSEVVEEPVTEVVRYGTQEPDSDDEGSSDDGNSGDGSDGGSDGGGGGDVGGDVDSLNWAALADCESGGDPQAVNPAGYYGLYQFTESTWQSVGGSGNPTDHSADEQTYRAKLLYEREGDSPWPSCGSNLYS